MAQQYQEIAARLRALTYATPGIIRFANALEAADTSHGRIRAAANALTDRDRAQGAAFLVQLRHDQLDVADTERACVLGELIEALARKEWEDLPALGPDSEDTLS